jgi:hypothetical protein
MIKKYALKLVNTGETVHDSDKLVEVLWNMKNIMSITDLLLEVKQFNEQTNSYERIDRKNFGAMVIELEKMCF